LSGRGLCDELITRPEESYRLCCVVVCDLETSRMGAPYIYGISRLRVNDLLLLTTSTVIENTFLHKATGFMKYNRFWEGYRYQDSPVCPSGKSSV